jgi:hypothetical protein
LEPFRERVAPVGWLALAHRGGANKNDQRCQKDQERAGESESFGAWTHPFNVPSRE